VALRIVFTYHALLKFEERLIPLDWIERALAEPDFVEPDPTQPGALRAFKAIRERDFRVLRVVYIDEGDERRIITVFFDRRRRR
jgi:hypothetical protein